MLRRLRADFPDSPVVVAFDAPGKVFREELYPAYKANRAAMPEELRAQVEDTHRIIRAMGMPLLAREGVEADDLIASLATAAAAQGQQVVISTADKDLAQLVSPKVVLVDTMKNTRLDVAGVQQKFGVRADQMTDFLALTGDSVDNVPGVAGVGPVAATALLAHFGDLDTLYTRLEEVPSLPLRGAARLKDKLAAGHDQALLSRTLVRVQSDLGQLPDPHSLAPPEEDVEQLRELYRQLEFRGWLVELGKPPEAEAPGEIKPEILQDEKAVRHWGELLAKAPECCIHGEVAWPGVFPPRLVGLAFALGARGVGIESRRVGIESRRVGIESRGEGIKEERRAGTKEVRAAYLPLAHEEPQGGSPSPQEGGQSGKGKRAATSQEDGLLLWEGDPPPRHTAGAEAPQEGGGSPGGASLPGEARALRENLRPLLEDADVPKLGHDLKQTCNALAQHGIELRGCRYDTMIESYVLNPSLGSHALDALCLRQLGEEAPAPEALTGKGARRISFAAVAVEQAAAHAALRARRILELQRVLWPQLCADEALEKIFREMDMPLVELLSAMECRGALVDRDYLRELSREVKAKREELSKEAFASAGEEFNLDSPQQLRGILFERLKLPLKKKTAKGQASTAEEVLQELALDFPLPGIILKYRHLSKLQTTYIDRLPEQINPVSGRVHTSYHQAVTATGRLSSSNPNLQNIPIRTPEGRQIRAAFRTDAGRVLVSCDYSQIELRIMAHLARDERLLEAFSQGLDIHSATAAEVFGVALEEVDGSQRRRAKAINFGLIYGMGAFGLARQLQISKDAAQQYIDRYFQRYPGVKHYMEEAPRSAARDNFVRTLAGRRLYVPDINAGQPQRRRAAQRAALNAPVQGSAADIMKYAMIEVFHWLQDSGLDAWMILQVHDELVFDAAEECLAPLCAEVPPLMSAAAKLSVPLEVDVKSGPNWADMRGGMG